MSSFITKIDINKFTFFLLFTCLFNKTMQTNDVNSTILIRTVYSMILFTKFSIPLLPRVCKICCNNFRKDSHLFTLQDESKMKEICNHKHVCTFRSVGDTAEWLNLLYSSP